MGPVFQIELYCITKATLLYTINYIVSNRTDENIITKMNGQFMK